MSFVDHTAAQKQQYIIVTLIVEKGLVGLGGWIVGVISFQKIFGLRGLKGHIYSCKR